MYCTVQFLSGPPIYTSMTSRAQPQSIQSRSQLLTATQVDGQEGRPTQLGFNHAPHVPQREGVDLVGQQKERDTTRDNRGCNNVAGW